MDVIEDMWSISCRGQSREGLVLIERRESMRWTKKMHAMCSRYTNCRIFISRREPEISVLGNKPDFYETAGWGWQNAILGTRRGLKTETKMSQAAFGELLQSGLTARGLQTMDVRTLTLQASWATKQATTPYRVVTSLGYVLWDSWKTKTK